MASKHWSSSSARWKRSCTKLWRICALLGIGNLRFTSTRTHVATDYLQGAPTAQSPFNLKWRNSKLVKAKIRCRLCSSLTEQSSRKGFQFDLLRKCIIPAIISDIIHDIVSAYRYYFYHIQYRDRHEPAFRFADSSGQKLTHNLYYNILRAGSM